MRLLRAPPLAAALAPHAQLQLFEAFLPRGAVALEALQEARDGAAGRAAADGTVVAAGLFTTSRYVQTPCAGALARSGACGRRCGS